MKYLIIIFIHLVAISHTVNSIWFADCDYEKNSSHVEYICVGETGARFSQRNTKFLYCNNYASEIIRGNLRILTFRGCKYKQLTDDFALDHFKKLRAFDLSTWGLETLNGEMFESNTELENFNASHNKIRRIPSNLFIYTPELLTIDFSHNKIEKLAPEMFDNVPKLRSINISHNLIDSLKGQQFSSLAELEFLDMSYNSVEYLDGNLFAANKKLKYLNLNKNQLFELKCEFLQAFVEMKVHSMTISVDTLTNLQTNCANEKWGMEFDVTVSPMETSQTTFDITDGRFEWIFNKKDFTKLRHLNFTNSHIRNIPSLLEDASDQLITLDLSNTFVGSLSQEILQNCTGLTYLNLSRTNLSNFQFATFYNYRDLKALDISYNNLNIVDFHLFLRNFQKLESLNVEGNNLTEIDTITRTHFPKLKSLATSKNNFSCEYLAKFLLQWHDLKLIENPSLNQVHIGGVDCYHEYQTTKKTSIKVDSEEKNESEINTHLKELFAIKILLMILLVMILIFFTYDKFYRVREIHRNRTRADIATESILYTHQEHNSSYI